MNRVIQEKNFFFYFYEYFAPYCQSSPKLRKRLDKRTNKIYLTWHFSTKCYPVFTNVYHLFYIDKKKSSTCKYNRLNGSSSSSFFNLPTFYKIKNNYIVNPLVSDYTDGVVWFNTCFICYFSSDCKNNRLDKLRINSIACKSYLNADTQKESIMKDNRRKSGIYKWTNKLNGKVYIGSSVNLSKRLSNYYNYNNLIKFQQNMLIHKALLKNGYSNFSLDILEYCEPSDVIEREQYYIYKLNPEYNLHRTAGSPFGYKHTEDTLAKFKNRVMTAKHKALLVKLWKN